jgi:DNA-binding SARP family transcriptional activator
MVTVPPLTIHLLGAVEVRHDPSSPPIALRRKTRALLAFLVATAQSHSRRTLVEMFCTEADDPYRALRSMLSRIRRRLGPDVLVTSESTVQFNDEVGWVDCRVFAQRLDNDSTSLPLDTLAETVNLYRGDFLEDVHLDDSPEFELWLLNERTRYQTLYERGLRRWSHGSRPWARWRLPWPARRNSFSTHL